MKRIHRDDEALGARDVLFVVAVGIALVLLTGIAAIYKDRALRAEQLVEHYESKGCGKW